MNSCQVRAAQTGVEKARPFSDELLSMIKGLVKKLKGVLGSTNRAGWAYCLEFLNSAEILVGFCG